MDGRWSRKAGWALLVMASVAGGARAAPLTLAVQPVLGAKATRVAFSPLARFLGQILGRPCRVVTSPNFLAYWESMRQRPGPTFVLDAAHFTDFRLTHLHYHVLVKEPGTISYSLVVRGSEMVLGPSALIGRRVASLGIPSMGAALLDQMFPHATRRPIVVAARDAAAEFRLLAAHRVAAAMIPTPLVARKMAQGADLSVVTTTPPIPNIALSAAPGLSAAQYARLRHALLGAPASLFQALGLPRFVIAHARQYRGQDRLLKIYWGY